MFSGTQYLSSKSVRPGVILSCLCSVRGKAVQLSGRPFLGAIRLRIEVDTVEYPDEHVKDAIRAAVVELKLDGQHIRFVFDCLRKNTTQIRNMKQYLLTVLYNAPVTAVQINHDLYGEGTPE